jgi:sugar phosphate isomerase/epimerase
MSWTPGISTGIAYQRPILEVLGPIQRAGFRAIEICTAPRHLELGSPAAIATLARAVSDLGLHVQSLHAPFGNGIDITSPDGPTRERSIERLTRAADALAELDGAGLFVIHPGSENERWAWDRDHHLARSVEALTRLSRVCRERRLRLVLETPLPHLLGGQLDDFDWILERLPSEGTDVCIDTSHCALGGFLELALSRLGARLVHIQASDNRGTTDDHLPPGEGRIDWAGFCKGLRRAGYAGVFMLEVGGHDVIEEGVARCAAAIRSVLPDALPPRRSRA